MQKKLYTLFFSFIMVLGLSAQEIIKDDSINAGDTITWTSNNEYLLDGYVFVEEGAVLNIEPGTVIKGMTAETKTTSDPASALIISRGGKIYAEGTAESPIVFTTNADPANLDEFDRGLWGGLVVLGKGIGGFKENSETFNIEGIPAEGGYGDKALYGGTDNADNSGVLKYISIRHAGFAISSDNELNGLTLGGVGSGTTIEYVEVFANADDGIEWFGGSVSVKYAIAAFCGDEAFDYDQSWSGNAQYLFAVQGQGDGEFGFEIDGSERPDFTPKETPVFSNITLIGSTDPELQNNGVFRMKNDGSGHFHNSVFMDFSQKGLRVDDADTYARYTSGDIVFNNNYWWSIGNATNLEETLDIRNGDASAVLADLTSWGNVFNDPKLTSISRDLDKGLNPLPADDSPLLGAGQGLDDSWFDNTSYIGAFGYENWANGWTALSELGILSDEVVRSGTIIVQDDDINAGDTVRWTSNNEYLLDGYVFVEEGAVLNIEPGTVIKGMTAETKTTSDPASALIISRGGKIYAEGTAESPIVFTTNADPANLDEFDRGLWGGLVVLGKGIGGFKENSETFNIEGIPAEGGYGDKALYGGTDNADNSGVLKYISIRHAGFAISSDNELNGLTLGGVGSGTTIEYVEVFANADDGIEWFGGSVSVKYAIAAFCGDEAFDYDQSWSGNAQYLFAVQGQGDGEFGFEIDGSERPDFTPKETPVFSNITLIGSTDPELQNNGVFRMKNDGSGHFHNSVFMDFSQKGLRVDDADTYARYTSGDIVFNNNYWWSIGNATNLEETLDIRNGDASAVLADLTTWGNVYADPLLTSISRDLDLGLNPMPKFDSPLLGAGQELEDAWFDKVDFIGAFGSENWAFGWTALSELNILTSEVTDVAHYRSTGGIEFYIENPARSYATLFIDSKLTDNNATFKIFDLTGKVFRTQQLNVNGGANTYGVDVSQLTNGVYFMTLEIDNKVISNKFIVAN